MPPPSATGRRILSTLILCGASTIAGCGGCDQAPATAPVGGARGGPTSGGRGGGGKNTDPSPISLAEVPVGVRARVQGFVPESAIFLEGSLLGPASRYYLTGKTAKGKPVTAVVSESTFFGFEGPVPIDLVPPKVLEVARATLPGVTLDEEASGSTAAWTEGFYDLQGVGEAGETSSVEIGESGQVYAIGHGPVPLDRVPAPILEQAKNGHPELTFEHAWFTKHNGLFGLHFFRDYYELRGPDKKGKPRTVKVKVEGSANVGLLPR